VVETPLGAILSTTDGLDRKEPIVEVNDGNKDVTAWPGLDEVDAAVIGALHADGRASMASMAKSLDLSVATVRQRYERLRSRGLVRAIALVDPVAVGRHVGAHVEVSVRTDVFGVAARLAAAPEVAWLAVGADLRTIYLQVSTRTNAGLATLVGERFRAADGVAGVRTAILLRNWSPVFRFGGISSPALAAPETDALWRRGEEPARAVDEVDLALLGCLEQDARMTITAMSERTGLSVPATRQRLVKLLGEGVARLRTRPSPLAEGVTVARLMVEVASDSAAVADAVVALPNISYVSESTGATTLTAELVCGREEQVREGYEQVCRTAGVVGVHVVRYAEVVVHTGHW
jgi:DNA-binding Lrp family transcriptional regulator